MSVTGHGTLPFAIEEYRHRQEQVRVRMRLRGIDILYVTSPANLLYLTGYEAIWYPPRLPVGVALDVRSERVTIFDWTRHEAYLRTRVLSDDIVLFDYAGACDTAAAAFEARGWTGRTVGLDGFSANPAPAILNQLSMALERIGARVVAGEWIVDGIRLYKSPAEVVRVRRAAAIADDALSALQRDLRPGMTAMEVSAQLAALLAQRGSDHAAMPPLVSAGPTAWTDVHSYPSHRPLEAGDVVAIDCCGVVDRYHANLARTFILGGADHPARAMLEWAGGGLEAMRDAARLGDGPEIALAVADAHVRQRIAPENIWWIGGYALGLGLAPSWVGHTYLANDGPEKCAWLPGYVSNFETVFFDRDLGFAAESIDTIVMTDQGLEILSGLPRGLLQAGA